MRKGTTAIGMNIEDEVAARIAIGDCLAHYARSVDRAQWDRIGESFHDGAYDDHGAYKGDISGFTKWVQEHHREVVQSMHCLTNTLIEFVSSDRALVETYFASYKTTAQNAEIEGARHYTNSRVLGRYIDIFELRAGNWAIARRTVVTEAVTMELGGVPVPPNRTLASRDDLDPLVLTRRELGLSSTPGVNRVNSSY